MNKADKKNQIINLYKTQSQCSAYSIHTLIKNKKLIVYGAGNGFIALLNTIINRYNILPTLILDSRFDHQTYIYDNIKANSLKNYNPTLDDLENSLVIVTVGSSTLFQNIYNDLRKKGFKHIIKSSEIFEFNLHHITNDLSINESKFYSENKMNILSAFDLFLDDKSLDIYTSIISTYISHKPRRISSDDVLEQYFPKDIKLYKGYDRFINCGAYDGDTVKQSLVINGKIEKLVCFEPDNQNFKLLSSYVNKHANEIADEITLFPCGVYDEETQLSFSSDKLLCSSIFDKGDVTIQCVSLDNVLPNFAPTFISMDVEGAEMYALRGSKNMIMKYTPDLAISVYHFPNHIWEIPLFLNSLDLGYKFYLRNYTGFTYETILYATIEDRK